MPTRTQTTDESGFIIIEVLVSAIILAIVAGAVLTLIMVTTRSAASGRNHSTAYALAQEDLAELRTFQISKLNRLVSQETVEIGGTKYVVESRGVFVNSGTGSTSCTEANSSADYVRISSTVSASNLRNPVTLESVVSPSSGSLDPTHGTISMQVNNALGTGVSGVTITGSGPSNFNGVTDSSGCAIFADIPYGNYNVVANGNGLITPDNETTWSETVGAPAKGTQQVSLQFDRAGTIAASFVYKEPKTNALTAAPLDAMEIFQSANGQKTITYGTPGKVPRSSTLSDELLYPFQTKYAVYAGSCPSNNPDPETKGINAAAIAALQVKGGATASAQIQVPALNLGVTYNGSNVQGAKVLLTDTTCKYNSVNVQREYTTNKVGHIVNASTELGTETQAVGLPFGTYNICVSAKINSSEYRKAEATGSSAAVVNNLTTAVSKTLALAGTSSTTSC